MFGPTAAVQYSTSIGGYSYYKYSWDYGYKAGVFVQYPLKENQSLRAEFTAGLLEYKYQFTNDSPTGTDYVSGFVHAGYLQVPLMYQRAFKSGIHLDGGGFAAFQISQHLNQTTYHHNFSDSAYTGGVNEGSHEITANRFQAGPAIAMGYLKSGFDLSLSSQYSMASLFPINDDAYKKQHLFALALNLAYHIK